MLGQDLIPFTFSFWPFLFGHYCLLSLVLLSCQGELQRSCSQTAEEKVTEHCQLACQCRSYPPLPPPPPPPPPPRLLVATVAEAMVPSLRPWWMEIIVLGSVGCASLVFLLSAVIICYKAIKRKPLRKEENGTSRGEYAMSIRNKKKKALGTNNTVV